MDETTLPPEWAYVAELPLSELAPRRVLADCWEDAGDPAGPALRQLCGVLDGRLRPEDVDAWPTALHRAALALVTPCPLPPAPPARPSSFWGRLLQDSPVRWSRPARPSAEKALMKRLASAWEEAWRNVAPQSRDRSVRSG